jgi:LPS-assembly protein
MRGGTMKSLFSQRMLRWLPFAGMLLVLCSVPVKAAGPPGKTDISKGPVTIEAEKLSYDREKDTYHAQGDVLITFTGGSLMAESVILDRQTNEAFAEGYVFLMSDGDILEGDRVKFDIDTKTGVAYEGRMFLVKNHFYLTGSKIEKLGEETYHVECASATTCDGDAPDWKFTGSELDVTIDGYGTLKHGKFLVKDFPVFYTPYLLFPAKTTRQSGFLFPRLSFSREKLGLDVEVPFYWAISTTSDATFYQRYMSKRGFKEGAEFRYFLSSSSFGTFYGDFMNDSGRVTDTSGGLSRNWQSDQKRWSYYLNHETIFDPSFSFRTDIRKVSDNWYFKDFSSHNYYLDNYSPRELNKFKRVPFVGNESLGSLDSTARLLKNWQLYNLTALVRYTDDFTSASNDSTLQKYPEITLKGIKRPVYGTPFNAAFDASYNYYYRSVGQKGHLYDLQPVFSVPLQFGNYLKFTPLAGVKGTLWDRDDNYTAAAGEHGDRTLYIAGANVTSEVSRIFHVGGEKVEKIRHAIKPELTYTYIPNTNQDDLPDFVARVPEQNTITYALTNTFTARLKEKAGGKSYQEFLRFKLAQTYDLKEARREYISPPREKRPFSDVDMELDVKPFQYLAFQARNKFSVNSGEWKQTNYDLNLSDWRGDSLTVGYRYTKSFLEEINPSGSITPFSPYRYSQSSLEEINLSLKAIITKSLSFTHVLRKNELDRKTLESSYGLMYSKQCWSVEMKYTETEDDKRYTVYFLLYGFGRLGGW